MSNTQPSLYTIVSDYLLATVTFSHDLLNYSWDLGKNIAREVLERYQNGQNNTAQFPRRNAITPAEAEDIRRNFEPDHSWIHRD
jgi:hypothetical protein